jgi:prevent-host-death family protein
VLDKYRAIWLDSYLAIWIDNMNIPLFDAKNRLSALVDQVVRGQEVTITRRGIPVAKLVPVLPSFDQQKARQTAERLRAASRGTKLAGVPIKELVEEGRK